MKYKTSSKTILYNNNLILRRSDVTRSHCVKASNLGCSENQGSTTDHVIRNESVNTLSHVHAEYWI